MSWGNVAGAAVGVAGGLLGGGGSRGGSTTSTGSAQPWKPQQQYLRDIFSRAQNLANLPAFSPQSAQAIEGLTMQAQDPNSLVALAQRDLGKTLSGGYLDVANNPYLSGAVQLGLDQARRNVSAAVGPEGFGGSAHQGWLMEQGAKYAAPIYAGQYSQERQNQLAAGQLAPGLQAANYDQLLRAGGLLETAPWTQLGRYGQAVGGQYGGSTTQTNPYFYNPWANALGGAAGAYSLYDRIRRGQGGGYEPSDPGPMYPYEDPGY